MTYLYYEPCLHYFVWAFSSPWRWDAIKSVAAYIPPHVCPYSEQNSMRRAYTYFHIAFSHEHYMPPETYMRHMPSHIIFAYAAPLFFILWYYVKVMSTSECQRYVLLKRALLSILLYIYFAFWKRVILFLFMSPTTCYFAQSHLLPFEPLYYFRHADEPHIYTHLYIHCFRFSRAAPPRLARFLARKCFIIFAIILYFSIICFVFFFAMRRRRHAEEKSHMRHLYGFHMRVPHDMMRVTYCCFLFLFARRRPLIYTCCFMLWKHYPCPPNICWCRHISPYIILLLWVFLYIIWERQERHFEPSPPVFHICPYSKDIHIRAVFLFSIIFFLPLWDIVLYYYLFLSEMKSFLLFTLAEREYIYYYFCSMPLEFIIMKSQETWRKTYMSIYFMFSCHFSVRRRAYADMTCPDAIFAGWWKHMMTYTTFSNALRERFEMLKASLPPCFRRFSPRRFASLFIMPLLYYYISFPATSHTLLPSSRFSSEELAFFLFHDMLPLYPSSYYTTYIVFALFSYIIILLLEYIEILCLSVSFMLIITYA